MADGTTVNGAMPSELEEWLGTMLLIRRFEEAAENASLRGKVPGGLHASIGQEAVAVGTARALGADDIVTCSHRPHHHALARGVDPQKLMAELFGRAGGLQQGRSGSMHIADFERGFIGANAIVGAGVGVAMGAALAAHLRETEQVAVAFIGEGGANTGRTWEFINMAAIWTLPLIVVCENNVYAVETHFERVTAGKSMSGRAEGFGMAAQLVDGQDVLAVHAAVKEARARALRNEGPSLIEALTYRYRGHETGDKGAYRTPEEIDEWRRIRDPIDRLGTNAKIDAQRREELEAGADERVAAAIAFAEASPWPSPARAGAPQPGVTTR
jgi:TPP-dependent pyruvate/acetoin dehydrogenase alpha subunit